MNIKYLNKTIGCLLASLCILPSADMRAQEEYTPLAGDYDFLAVKNVKLSTQFILEYGNLKPWNGEGLHAGVQSLQLSLFNCKDIPKDVVIPDNPSFSFEITDMEGNVAGRMEMDMTQVFAKLKHATRFNEEMSMSQTVIRGGEYKLKAEISPSLFSYETEMTLPDEARIQVSGNQATVDSQLSPKIFITSGYPYVAADFAGEKHLHWQVAPVNLPETVVAEGDEVFELKSDTPTLAAFADVWLKADILTPGEYIYTLTSDFAPANYSFKAILSDVLLPEITLNKEIYKVGENAEAVITVDMNYGYPYVGVGSSSDKPTVTVCAELLGKEISKEYSDEAWADSDMHCTAELSVPLDKVTEEVVKEYNGEVPMNLSVQFNDTIMFETVIKLPFDNGTGINGIAAEEDSEVKYYNIFGIEVDPTYKGIIITGKGQKIIR